MIPLSSITLFVITTKKIFFFLFGYDLYCRNDIKYFAVRMLSNHCKNSFVNCMYVPSLIKNSDKLQVAGRAVVGVDRVFF